jgi:hypothetical protein
MRTDGFFLLFRQPSSVKAKRQTLQLGCFSNRHFSAGVLLLQPDPTKMTCSMTDMSERLEKCSHSRGQNLQPGHNKKKSLAIPSSIKVEIQRMYHLFQYF